MFKTKINNLNLFNKLAFRSTSNVSKLNIIRQFSSKPNSFLKNYDLLKFKGKKMSFQPNLNFRFVLGSVSLAAFTAGMVSFNELKNDAMSKEPSIIPTVESNADQSKHKLTYDDLTYGSICGLFLGIVIGKLSYVLALISMATFLTIEFLRNRNILYLNWNGLIQLGSSRIDLRKLIFDNFSFKLSFILSFVIAAWNIQY